MEDIEQGGNRGRESEGVNKYIGREVGGREGAGGEKEEKKAMEEGV